MIKTELNLESNENENEADSVDRSRGAGSHNASAKVGKRNTNSGSHVAINNNAVSQSMKSHSKQDTVSLSSLNPKTTSTGKKRQSPGGVGKNANKDDASVEGLSLTETDEVEKASVRNQGTNRGDEEEDEDEEELDAQDEAEKHLTGGYVHFL